MCRSKRHVHESLKCRKNNPTVSGPDSWDQAVVLLVKDLAVEGVPGVMVAVVKCLAAVLVVDWGVASAETDSVGAAAAGLVAAAMEVDVVAMAAAVARQSGMYPSLWWRWERHRTSLVASIRVQTLGRFHIAQTSQSCCCMLYRFQLHKSTSHIRMAWR